jgi:hypothetical protein
MVRAANGKTQTMIRTSTLLIAATMVFAADRDIWAQTPLCGVGLSDWCPAPPGDPCGAHGNTAQCKADPRCYGMPYRGESVVPCLFDARGFASNCPTVGCTSTRPADATQK